MNDYATKETMLRSASGVSAVSQDSHDAKRLIDAAVALTALPTIMSERARELTVTHLRGVLESAPGAAPVLRAIIRHLEQPGSE